MYGLGGLLLSPSGCLVWHIAKLVHGTAGCELTFSGLCCFVEVWQEGGGHSAVHITHVGMLALGLLRC